jgi:RHS repeat-associated protein
VSDPFGYEAQAGYYTDQSTGLILTTFRYYDPGAARFLNRDPIAYLGGVNLYGYVHNDGVNSGDVIGLSDRGRGHSRGGGNDPRYALSCEVLWEMYNAASGKEKDELNTILKHNKCKGSGNYKGKPQPIKCPPILPPVLKPKPVKPAPPRSIKPVEPKPVEPEPIEPIEPIEIPLISIP